MATTDTEIHFQMQDRAVRSLGNSIGSAIGITFPQAMPTLLLLTSVQAVRGRVVCQILLNSVPEKRRQLDCIDTAKALHVASTPYFQIDSSGLHK